MAIPEKTTRREAIRLLAQAAMCSVWFDRSGVLRFAKLTGETPMQMITADELYNYDGVSVTEPVDKVELHVKSDYADIDVMYTTGSGKNVKTVTNPCVAPSNYQKVADWLFDQYNRRFSYQVKNRCDPALETGDVVEISDAYGQNRTVVQTGLELSFNGIVTAVTKGVGV